tara:strand:+ start:4805 stop:5245 length:441 start_codon:yes stop_codon:yes gene_type:complete
MTLIKWSPKPANVFNGMDNIFNSIFNDDLNYYLNKNTDRSMDVDIKESDTSFTLTCDIPGVKKKNITVSINEDVLTISGVRESMSDDESDIYHYKERSRGTFSRSFTLPECILENKVKANFKDGILKLELPKTEIAKAKQIDIKVS